MSKIHTRKIWNIDHLYLISGNTMPLVERTEDDRFLCHIESGLSGDLRPGALARTWVED